MTQNSSEIAEELVAIKKLMIVALAKSGLTQTEIGTALGIDRTTVAKMFPSRFLSNLGKEGQ